MSKRLQVLLIEDNAADAQLLQRHLEQAGYTVAAQRVQTAAGLIAALQAQQWDLVLSDYAMHGFDGLGAWRLLRDSGRDIPFILVSGTTGEEVAVEAVRAGIGDYVLKDNLGRLVPAVERELREAEERRRRRTVEEALVESEEVFRAFSQSSPLGLYLSDRQGQYVYVNPRWREICSLTLGQSLAAGWAQRLHADDRERVVQQWQACAAAAKPFDAEYRIQTDESAVRWVRSRAAVRSSEMNVPVGHIGTLEDITERKQAEEILRLQSTALEAAANGIVITDREGVICWCNPSFTMLTGYSPDEALGRNPRFLKSGAQDATFYQSLWRTITSGQVWRGELVNRRKDDTRYTEYMTITPVRDHEGAITHFVAIKENVSERKRAEAALRRSEEELRESNRHLTEALGRLKQAQAQMLEHERLRVLGQMASGIAHNFNNALAPVLGFGELLLQRPDLRRDDRKLAQCLELILTGARDAVNVVRRLRELYRRPGESVPLQPVNLSHLVQQVVALTKPRWQDQTAAAGHPVHVEMDLAEVPLIAAHESELREVVTNLLFNAVDAMPDGGTMHLCTRQKGHNVELMVRDNGLGMTPEVRQRCCEMFFTTKGAEGTGLGLATVQAIVRQHDGTLDLDTAPGRGTTFTIRLPVRSTPQPANDRPARSGRDRFGRILFADDEALVREVFAEYLTQEGHEVVVAGDGEAALAQFRARTFDLVITDMAMPGSNGEQLAAKLRTLNPHVPVILLTGFGDIMKARGECPPGVAAVVAKPVSLCDLREAVQVALAAQGTIA